MRSRQEFVRKTGGRTIRKIVVLAYEGNKTEPQYFEAFRAYYLHRLQRASIYVHSLTRSRDDTKSAPNHVLSLLEQFRREYNFKKNDEFWLIVDADRWNLDPVRAACSSQPAFNLAVSIPCFELWLLLHVLDVATLSEVELRMLAENRRVSSRRRYIEETLSTHLGRPYNKNDIQTDVFMDKIQRACEHALKLEQNATPGLSSDVYRLIDSLVAQS